MNTVLESSQKIKKTPRNATNNPSKPGERSYICGGCQKSYKSYPALYLHIKRKHNGIRPADTRASKPIASSKEKLCTGRPQKPYHNIDNINEVECEIEELQNELLGFLGNDLGALSGLEAKPKLQDVVKIIKDIPNSQNEEYLERIKETVQELFGEITDENTNDIDIHLDYEEIKNVAPGNSLKTIVWFILWMSRYSAKANFIPDMCIIFSKVIKILYTMSLEIQDLDNKLVWNNVARECDPFISNFRYFNKNKELVLEFIKKVCHLIGKTFE